MEENKKKFDPVEVDENYFYEHHEEQEAFYDLVRKLPGPILDVLFGTATAATIEQISSVNQLTPFQSASLSRLIRKVLTAEFYFGDLVSELKKQLTVDEGKANAIGTALINLLFPDALEDIKKMHKEKFGKNDNPPPINPSNILDLRNKDQ